MTPRRALFAMILATTAVRLFWAANFGPGNDEAYHYLFTTHPDWSYFDHPPMVALVAAPAEGTLLQGTTAEVTVEVFSASAMPGKSVEVSLPLGSGA